MSGLVAGIGCRPGCAPEEILSLVRRAERLAGEPAALLAAPEFRAEEAASAAAALGLPATLLGLAALRVVAGCVTHSAASLRAYGVASVAEASALAAAGPGARLRLARIASARATCALAAPR